MLQCHLHATRGCQLLAVNLAAHAVLEACLKDARRLLGGEEALVAEHIHKVGKALGGHSGDHLVDDEVNIVGLAAGIFASHGMSAQEGRYHTQTGALLDAGYHAQHLEFVLGVEAVAALYLDGSGALGNHLAHALHGSVVELLLGHEVQAVGAVEDAAATAGNLGVGESVDFIHKLLLATASIDDVGVRVAPAGQHCAAAGINNLVNIGWHGAVVGSVKLGDDAVFHEHPSVVDGIELRHLLTASFEHTPAVDTGEGGDILN